MSSKSRKGSKTPQTKHTPKATLQARRPQAPEKTADLEDEVVHVPKGKSRLQFLLVLGLMVFTLIIFTVGDMLATSMGPSRGRQVFMTWKHPTLGTQKVEGGEFRNYKLGLDSFYRVAYGGRFRIDIRDEDVALEMIHDALAQEAGIAVTAAELRSAILEGLPGLTAPQISGDYYRQNVQAAGVTPRVFEAVLARKMRIARWEQMRMTALALASPEQIEAAWKENHQQYAFDYVPVENAALMEESAALVPADEELAVWFDELPDKALQFADDYTEARAKAEIVGLLTAGEKDAAALLERYPREGDPEEEARNYFNTQRSLRFRREKQLEVGDEGFDDIEQRIFLPYEEVAEAVRREAPVYYALRDWLADLKERASGEEVIDLIAEAAELGLDTYTTPELLTKEELEAIEGWGSPFMSSTFLFSPAGTLATDVTVTKGAILLGRTTERLEAAPPEFEAVKDKVAEKWKAAKLPEIAGDKLQAVRDALWVERKPEPSDDEGDEGDEADDELAAILAEEEDQGPDHEPVTPEAFAAAAQAAGLTVQRRDWLEFDAPVGADPDYALPAHAFIAARRELADLEEGELSEVLADSEGEGTYLILSLGKRDPEVVRIDPGELEEVKAQADIGAYVDFREKNMTRESYSKKFELRLLGEDGKLEP
jgi:hypothetical protein